MVITVKIVRPLPFYSTGIVGDPWATEGQWTFTSTEACDVFLARKCGPRFPATRVGTGCPYGFVVHSEDRKMVRFHVEVSFTESRPVAMDLAEIPY